MRIFLLFVHFCLRNEALEKCKRHIELIANTLQLEGFSRIDAFVNVDSGEVIHLMTSPYMPSFFFPFLF